jgi:hypothetical protein
MNTKLRTTLLPEEGVQIDEMYEQSKTAKLPIRESLALVTIDDARNGQLLIA